MSFNLFPTDISPPTTCKYIYIYSMNENYMNYYMNFCMRKNYLSRIDMSNSVKMPALTTFTKNLRNEMLFGGSDCENIKPPVDNAIPYLSTIRCTSYPTIATLEAQIYILTNSFLSTTSLTDGSTDGDPKYCTTIATKMRFRIPTAEIVNYGRDIDNYSAHDEENEFLLVPNLCFLKVLRPPETASNEFFFEPVNINYCNAVTLMLL